MRRRAPHVQALLTVLLTCAAAAAVSPPAARADEPSELRRELDSQLATIDAEVSRLRESGAAAGAKALAEKVAHWRQRLAGKAASEGAGSELHVVGLYEAPPLAGARRGFNEHPVEVQATDRPVVLVVCSYEPVRWDLKVAKDAKLVKVIAGGYYDQEITGVPDGVPVEKYVQQPAPGQGPGQRVLSYAYTRDTQNYPALVKAAKALTGIGVSTFQGTYRFETKPFVIGPGNADWEAQRVLTDLRPSYLSAAASERAGRRESFRQLRFWSLLQTIPQDPRIPQQAARHFMTASLAEFTPAGPIANSVQALPKGVTDVAVDARGPTFYGVTRDGAFELDLRQGQVVQLGWDADLPHLSWPRGLAFDTKRQRLVLGAGGGLFAWAPATKKWSRLSPRPDMDFSSLTYAAAEDVFYALPMHDSGAKTLLRRFDAEGKPAGNVALSRALPTNDYDRPDHGPQIVSVGSYLAIVTPPVIDVLTDPEGPEQALCYLVEPKTGRVIYHGPMQEQPDPGAGVIAAEELGALWSALRGADAASADKAMWRMASGGDRTVEFLAERLPPAAVPDAARARELVAKLADDDADAREIATLELRQAGAGVVPELRRVLGEEPAPETKSRLWSVLAGIASDRAEPAAAAAARWDDDPLLRRERRGITVLSRIGTPASLRCLRALAAGSEGSPRTVQTSAALRQAPAEP